MSAKRPEALVPLTLEAPEPEVLRAVVGAGGRVLRRVEEFFEVRVYGPPGRWEIAGRRAEDAARAILRLAARASEGVELDALEVESALKEQARAEEARQKAAFRAGRKRVLGKTAGQHRYLTAMLEHDLTIAVGPAGTGKTYLAVAAAVRALQRQEVERIVLTRPAVEAGERLGFLPGDMQQKVDPYLRPLYDALADLLGLQKMQALIESGRIEVAPLAYMRGRTLSGAFAILDEAQNTTREQMKMFLTRLGFGSRMVVTGDATQIDLPEPDTSGLLQALKVLEGVKGVAVVRLSREDVVRHPLVERIVAAYDRGEAACD